MNLMLVFLACTGFNLTKDKEADPADPASARDVDARVSAPEVRIPDGEVLTRRCFETERERAPKGSSGPLGRVLGNRQGSTRTTSVTPPPGAAMGAGGSSLGGRGDATAAPAMEIAQAEATPAAASPADDGLADPSASGASAKDARSASRAPRPRPKAPTVRPGKIAAAEPVEEEAKPRPVQPSVDWGGVTWLSNDDSMSLASAQRLLWALKSGERFTAAEVRPHELLNYFSFDTAPLEEGETFSVLGSAQQTGSETLTVALAIQGANPPREPLDLTLVVDVSGSMWAEGRMDYVKRGLHQVEGQLQRGDRVDLVLFDHETCAPLENYVAGRDDARVLTDAIDAIVPRGSTNLDLGLKEGYRLAKQWADADPGRERNHRVMILTDALLNEGQLDPDTIATVAENYERSDVRLSGVGVGTEFNDKVLDTLTEKGKGAYVFLGSEAVVDRILGAGFESLTRTIAHDVRFSLDLPESLGMAKFYGEESSADPEDVKPIHYFADTSQVFLQDLRMRDGRLVSSDPVSLKIVWRDASTDEPREKVWNTTVGGLLEGDKHNVQKARALMSWSDLLIARAMGGDPCGAPFATYRERAGLLSDDAEMAYVSGLTGPFCGEDLGTPSGGGVAFRVKLDSDVPIAEVELLCRDDQQKQTLSAGDSVARFSTSPGTCTLTLQGAVPMVARVEVPSTGGDVRCLVRGGRMDCS